MEMWLSANTTTPDTPPFGVKWWKWLCNIVAPARIGRLPQRRIDVHWVGEVLRIPQVGEKMRAGKPFAILLDEVVLPILSLATGRVAIVVWFSLGSSETIPS